MLGLDFGTTNSAVGIVDSTGRGALARFRDGDGSTTTFRSALHFPAPPKAGRSAGPVPLAGPRAIASYLDEGGGGRFLQSLKSSLASRLFEETYVFGWKFTLEDLIAVILSGAARGGARAARRSGRRRADRTAGALRPARRASVDARGRRRSRSRGSSARARLAGFAEVRFEYEPVAAAYQYERGLDRDELVLIGDFGGGTSDFCLIRLGPRRARAGRPQGEHPRRRRACRFAGDAFDGRIVRARGRAEARARHRSPLRARQGAADPRVDLLPARALGGRLASSPTPQTLETLRQLAYQARDPRRLESLIRLVEDDLGYLLYREVERRQARRSRSASGSRLRLPRAAAPDRPGRRARRPRAVDRGPARADGGLRRRAARALRGGSAGVDRVFLTGGSSLVPSVRALFAERFGADRLRGGEELTTVARGLALIAAER